MYFLFCQPADRPRILHADDGTGAVSATIGYHQKTVILYNMKGFWDGVICMLDDLQAKGVMRWRAPNMGVEK